MTHLGASGLHTTQHIIVGGGTLGLRSFECEIPPLRDAATTAGLWIHHTALFGGLIVNFIDTTLFGSRYWPAYEDIGAH